MRKHIILQEIQEQSPPLQVNMLMNNPMVLIVVLVVIMSFFQVTLNLIQALVGLVFMKLLIMKMY